MISFGIIGCGRIAQRHAEHISKKGKLVAVCDIDVAKADALASQYNCKAFYTAEELCGSGLDINVVAICSPNGLHAEHSILCFQNGFHVLCEKPMGLSVNECGRMIQSAEKANKRLFAIKQNRFNPPVAAVKELLDEGKLGRVMSIQLNCFWNRNEDYYRNSWKGTKKLDGGTLFTQFSHFIDLLYWMFGDVSDVQAFMGNYIHKEIIEFEDTGVVILRFDSGAIGTINYTVNCLSRNMEGSLTIFGEKGTVKIGGQYLNTLEYQDILNHKVAELPEGNKPNNYGQYVGSMSNHDKVYDNVIDVLEKNAAINTSAFEGMKTVEIISRIYKSATIIE